MRRSNQIIQSCIESLESRVLMSCAPVAPMCGQSNRSVEVTVMSQNLYFGADLAPVLGVALQNLPPEQLFPALAGAVSQVWQVVQQTNFTVRAERLADEIAAARPDIIGLQEAERWIFIPPTGPQNAQVTDYIGILTSALESRGMHYAPVIVTQNFDATLPDAQGDFIEMTDRNAILVNTDEPGLQVTSSADGHFAAQITLGQPPLVFAENCSWQSVDFTDNGRAFRYVNTHLTSIVPVIQEMQAAELLAGPGQTNLPIIFGGDFNSDATGGTFGGPDITATYGDLVGAGLTDAWLTTHHGGQPGLTWGQGTLLDNQTSTVSERIDYFLTAGAIKTQKMKVVGTRPIESRIEADTPPFWGSDHCGIVATFKLTARSANASRDRDADSHDGDCNGRLGESWNLDDDMLRICEDAAAHARQSVAFRA